MWIFPTYLKIAFFVYKNMKIKSTYIFDRVWKGVVYMTQGRLSKVKKFRISPEEAKVLADKAEQAGMTEAEYMRLLISQKTNDYPEIRILLKELINEVNKVYETINKGKFDN